MAMVTLHTKSNPQHKVVYTSSDKRNTLLMVESIHSRQQLRMGDTSHSGKCTQQTAAMGDTSHSGKCTQQTAAMGDTSHSGKCTQQTAAIRDTAHNESLADSSHGGHFS